MSEQDFDNALITAAFRLAAEVGWARVTVAEAARMAGLSLAEARVRFPAKHSLLLRFGQRLDQAALSAATGEGPVRDQLFDLLMSRFDAMKPHREGVAALVRYLPTDPATTLLLACSTRRGMRWMLHAAGQSTTGLRGAMRVKGLVAVWTWTSRTFVRDESEDLSATMAALDTTLGRVHRVAAWISGERVVDKEPDESAVLDSVGDPA
jgi:AcrR family transcriptional regulator